MQFQIPIFQSADSDKYYDHSHYFSENENGFFDNLMQRLANTQCNPKGEEQLNVSFPIEREEPIVNNFDHASSNQPQIFYLDKQIKHLGKQDRCSINSKKEGKRRLRRQKNDTKNIPKNFGKGIMNFIQKHPKKVRQLLSSNSLDYNDFLKMVRTQKKTINTIANLREIWTHQKYGRVMRILSNLFFRKHSFYYIFNSRISSFSTHLKYRHVLWSATYDPNGFNLIKKY